MSRYLKAAIGLTSALFLVTTLQARVVTAEVSKPEPLLLAQKKEPEKAKAPSPESVLKKPKAPKAKVQPRHQRHMHRRSRSLAPLNDEPSRAGTKKIGGHPIRAKDSPQGE